MNDFWNECFQPDMKMSPDVFAETFCRRCQNPDCKRAGWYKSKFQHRITTQVDRLLDNPTFADPNDPRTAHIRSVDFPQMLREAMKLEISSQKGDWQIPTEADAVAMAGRMAVGAQLTPEVKPPEPDPEPAMPEPEPEVQEVQEPPLREMPQEDGGEPITLKTERIRGTRGDIYEVKLIQENGGEPHWTCTCPHFHHKQAVCKHITWVMANPMPEPEPEPVAPPPQRFQAVPPAVQAPSPASRTGAPVTGAERQMFVPRRTNIPVPSGGIMVDGSEPPPRNAPAPASRPVADSWAIPNAMKAPDNIVPVGSKIRMGMGVGEGKKK